LYGSQNPATPIWKTSDAHVTLIGQKLAPPRKTFHSLREPNSSDPDARYENRIKTRSTRFYAHISPLTEEHTTSGADVDWYSKRAWFDECVKAARRRDLERGRWWTGAHFPGGPSYSWKPGEGQYEDSYRENDYEEWEHRQEERDRSLTFLPDLQGGGVGPSSVLETVDEIVELK
jgi:hypothetical protein